MPVSKNIQRIAMERIRLLFLYAQQNEKWAGRYASLIKKIAAKAQIKLPIDIKRSICKGCGRFLYGKNLLVRINKKSGCVERTCLACGRILRVPKRKV